MNENLNALISFFAPYILWALAALLVVVGWHVIKNGYESDRYIKGVLAFAIGAIFTVAGVYLQIAM